MPTKIHDQTLPIASIKVGHRHRKDLGDLEPLAESLEIVGLLHPVVIDTRNRLIAGQRRLEAAKLLGWKTIPVRVIDLDALTLGEFAENACRNDFTPSEIAAIAKVLRPLEEQKAHQRRLAGLRNVVVENCHNEKNGKTRDIVARFTGISGRTLDKISAIVDAAEDQPGRYGHLKEELDAEPRSVHRCYNIMKVVQQQIQEQAARSKVRKPHWTITGDQTVVKCDLGLFDPPYGISDEPWEPDDLEEFTRDWCERWINCRADFLAIFWSQEHLFDGRSWFDESLSGYKFQQVLVWHGRNTVKKKYRFTFRPSWEPILLYRRNDCHRHIKPSGSN